MTEHTPGPWRVAGENCPECWVVENEEGDFIAQCEDRRGFATLDAVENARLIAAAPEAVDMLEAAVALLRVYGEAYGNTASEMFIRDADALLAKARGVA